METTPDSSLPTQQPPPTQVQPDPKRLKMSSTTTTDDDEQSSLPPNHPRKLKYKRRKIAIFFAYCGVNYQGMQKNPGAKTIEGDLEEALFQSGAIPEEDRGQPKKFDWARSARTDKGVSAVGQVVSGRFYIDPVGFIQRLNDNLVEQIRVFGYKRATPGFNAKKFCDRRRYVYLIPVFVLDKDSHRDRESVARSYGTGEELVKCVECSERGRKVFGVMGNNRSESKNGLGDLSSENGNVGVKNEEIGVSGTVSENVVVKNEEIGVNGTVSENVVVKNEEIGVNEVIVKKEIAVDSVEVKNTENDNGNGNEKVGSGFCYGEKEKERFNRVLKYYEGTHNFHNFTTRTKAEDPAAKRYILSFTANTVVNVDGIDFIKCEVLGQSFMLHQIRKMIGLAVAIMRDYAPESLIETAFGKDVKITVPMAPEVGLYLDECFFPSYNVKWKNTHEELSMKDYIEEAENFKMKHIYPHIALMEHKYGNMALWLHSLNYRNYPDLRYADNIPNPSLNTDEVSNGIQNAADSIPISSLNTDEVSNDVQNAALSANVVSDNVQNSALNADEVSDNVENPALDANEVCDNVQNSTSSELKNDETVNMVE